MIARNDRTQIRKRLSQQHAKSLAHKQQQAQVTLNGVLWQIITKNTELASDGDVEDAPAMLTIPCADLKEIPPNFGLTIKKNVEDETISIIAVLIKPKSNIILPGSG